MSTTVTLAWASETTERLTVVLLNVTKIDECPVCQLVILALTDNLLVCLDVVFSCPLGIVATVLFPRQLPICFFHFVSRFSCHQNALGKSCFRSRTVPHYLSWIRCSHSHIFPDATPKLYGVSQNTLLTCVFPFSPENLKDADKHLSETNTNQWFHIPSVAEHACKNL